MRARDDSGQTLIELVVAMTLAIVVLVVVLNGFDLFDATTQKANDAAGAQDTARTTARSMVGVLRQARVATGQTTPIPSQWTPSRTDLTVAAYVSSATDPTPGSVPGWVRYCATTGSPTSLLIGVRAGDAYAAPGDCALGDTVNAWSYAPLVDETLQDPAELFDFTSPACQGATCLPAGPQVEAVGLRVAVGTRPGATAQLNAIVRDAVSFRNRSTA